MTLHFHPVGKFPQLPAARLQLPMFISQCPIIYISRCLYHLQVPLPNSLLFITLVIPKPYRDPRTPQSPVLDPQSHSPKSRFTEQLACRAIFHPWVSSVTVTTRPKFHIKDLSSHPPLTSPLTLQSPRNQQSTMVYSLTGFCHRPLTPHMSSS